MSWVAGYIIIIPFNVQGLGASITWMVVPPRYPIDHPYLIGCSIINHPFGDTPIYGNPLLIYCGVVDRPHVQTLYGDAPGEIHQAGQSVQSTGTSIMTACWWNPTTLKWGAPKLGVPQNGWFKGEDPIKMDDLGVPPFMETLIFFWEKIVVSQWHGYPFEHAISQFETIPYPYAPCMYMEYVPTFAPKNTQM